MLRFFPPHFYLSIRVFCFVLSLLFLFCFVFCCYYYYLSICLLLLLLLGGRRMSLIDIVQSVDGYFITIVFQYQNNYVQHLLQKTNTDFSKNLLFFFVFFRVCSKRPKLSTIRASLNWPWCIITVATNYDPS